MPKILKRPPKYRLHKSTGQAVVSVHGKVIQLGPFGSPRSHERYQQEVERWRAGLFQQHPERAAAEPEPIEISIQELQARRRRGQPVTINEIALLYEDYAHGYYVKNGVVTREGEQVSEMLRLLLRYHGEDELDEFGPVRLKEHRERMITEFNWSRKYINENVNRIRRLFAWACENELASPIVHQALQTVAGLKKGRSGARETKKVTVVEDAVVDSTLKHAPEIVADMVRFQRLTGARPGEVCELRPCDLDRSEEIWVYEPDGHKTEHHDKTRLVMIGPKAQAILQPYLDRDAEAYCFVPAETAWIAKHRRGARGATAALVEVLSKAHAVAVARGPLTPYDANSYRIAVNRAAEKAKVPKWSPNRLRHTAATEVRKRFGLEAAQVVCGHQTADVTQVYAERNITLAKEVAKTVG
ncbi:MAG: site-specific integrase [Planctomycetota bacterium]